jgi:hypothetical protein
LQLLRSLDFVGLYGGDFLMTEAGTMIHTPPPDQQV